MTNDVSFCDGETGACTTTLGAAGVTVTVATDPLCSACWVMEPAWRKLVHHHGARFTVKHVYGVLLPAWDGFADPGAGIAGPTDVPVHWNDISRRWGQPIDASVWHTDPVPSTIPAAVALVRARELAPVAEARFLRRLRELVLAEGRNIARHDVLAAAARDAGMSAGLADIVAAAPDDATLEVVTAERERMRALGAVSFPTLVFESAGRRTSLAGAQPYPRLRRTLALLCDDLPDADDDGGPSDLATLARHDVGAAIAQALTAYRRATTREIAELVEVADPVAESVLADVADRGPGSVLWRLRSNDRL